MEGIGNIADCRQPKIRAENVIEMSLCGQKALSLDEIDCLGYVWLVKVAILAEFPLHVIPDFGEAYVPKGHYATWFPQLAQAYAGFPDLDAHWIVLSPRLKEPREVRWNGQTFHILPTGTRGRASTLFAKDRKAIQSRIASIQPQLVHGWGTEDVHGLAAVNSGLPNIVSLQGILSHYILKNRMPLRNYLQATLELYVLLKAGCVTVESSWGRDVVLHRNPKARVRIVEYGVQNDFLEIKWRPDPRKPAAIFIGSLVPRKGIQDAVASFRDPALAQAELWAVGGDGDAWAEKLRAEAPPNVRWLGQKTPAQTAELLSRAWCFLLPTRADTSPNVVKEARVIGLPVISTPCGGQTAYIRHGENGFLIEPGDIEALTRSAVALLSGLERCKAMGACDHEKHRQILHPMETARNFYRIYREIIASGSVCP